MSKKDKAIALKLKETATETGMIYELFYEDQKIGDKAIGQIVEENKVWQVQVPQGQSYKVKSLDDGVNDLIMAYNLHH